MQSNNIDLVIIPGGCTSKIQPLDVCLNKPLKSVVRKKWIEYVHSLVNTSINPSPQNNLIPPKKPDIVAWIMDGIDYLKSMPEMVKKSFFVCGITKALDGSQNTLIRCAKELPSLELPYIDGSEDPFGDEPDETTMKMKMMRKWMKTNQKTCLYMLL